KGSDERFKLRLPPLAVGENCHLARNHSAEAVADQNNRRVTAGIFLRPCRVGGVDTSNDRSRNAFGWLGRKDSKPPGIRQRDRENVGIGTSAGAGVDHVPHLVWRLTKTVKHHNKLVSS